MTYRVGSGGTAVTGSAIIPSRRRLAIVCDDVGLPNGAAQFVGVNASPLSDYSQNTWWVWALAVMGWPYELVAISSAAGRTTAQAASAFGTEVAAFTPDEVWVCIGRNDMTSSATATAALTQLDNIIASCLAVNPTMIVRISTVIPGDGTSNTTAYQAANTTFNYGVQKRQYTNKNVQVIDMGAVLRDPTSLTSTAISGSISASSHLGPVPVYSCRMGRYWAAKIGQVPTFDLRAIGGADVYNSGGNTVSNRFIINPTMSGSGGAITGTGGSGTVPASWSLDCGNGVTAVGAIATDSVPSANSFPQRWWTLTLGGTATSVATVAFNVTPPATMFPPLVAGTSIVRSRVSIKTSSLANVQGVFLFLQATADFITYQANTSTAYPSGTTGFTSEWPAAFTLEMPAFKIPAGPTTVYPFVGIQVASGASPTGTVSISDLLIEQVV